MELFIGSVVGEILKDKQRNLTTSMAAFYVREGGPNLKKIALKTFFSGEGVYHVPLLFPLRP